MSESGMPYPFDKICDRKSLNCAADIAIILVVIALVMWLMS